MINRGLFYFRKHSTAILVIVLSQFLFASCIKKFISIKKGDKLYTKGNYYEAKNYYEKAVSIDTTSYIANLKLGLLLNEELNQIDESLPYLIRAARYKKTKDTIPDILKAFGDYCFYASAYNKAGTFYKEIGGLIIDNSLQGDVNSRLSNIVFALNNPDKSKKSQVGILNLGHKVNSYYAEYNSVFDNTEKKFYYTARRPETTGKVCDSWDGKYYEDMYITNHVDRFDFTQPENFTNHAEEVKNIKNTKKHEAIVSLSDNDSILFSYKNNSIYVSKIKNGVWSEPEKMDKKINKGHYQNHISISPDNKSIFFSSTKRGGYGGLDLYMLNLKSDSTWSDPVNLGDKINTNKDEESVEILHDNKTIVFASKGLPGYGGYDLFFTERKGPENFQTPQNFGPQINSPSDDTYLKLDSTMTEGFLSSSRRGGYGDMDIYRFYFLNKPDFNKCSSNDSILDKQIAKLIPADKIKPNDTLTLDVSSFSDIHGHPSLYSFWKIDNEVIKKDTNQIKISFATVGQHTIHVQFVAKCDTCYERLTYCYKKEITVKNIDSADTLNPNIIIGEIPNGISLNPVYFDFDKYGIRKDATATLNEDIKTMLSNKNIQINVIANADSRGSKSYNQALSERRANSVVQYLLKNNISRDKIITIISLGETKPVNDCGDSKKCPESEYQKNRRVDLIISKVNIKD